MTRPDISNAASTLAGFSGNPSKEHFDLAERCLTYLRDTKFLALMFDGKVEDSADFDVLFKCSSDASYADDAQTRRSTCHGSSSALYLFTIFVLLIVIVLFFVHYYMLPILLLFLFILFYSCCY